MKKTFKIVKARLRPPATPDPNTRAPTSSKPVLRTTLNAAETSIRLLKELSDAVPFIGIAASAAVFIIEGCKRYGRNSRSYEELLKSVQNLDRLLSPYKDGNSVLASEVTKSLDAFTSAILNVRSEVERLQSSNRISQFVNSADNEIRVTELIQKVKEAIDNIMASLLASLLHISLGVQDITNGVKEIGLSQSLLALNPVHTARYNCVDRDRCLTGTRVTVLDDIQKWFDEGEEQIYWLNGAAGMGKTAIALSVAHRLVSNRQLLMATFFCSRESADRKDAGLIFPTIACQLASLNRGFQDALVESLGRYPYAGSALPHEQVQRLILEPLQKVEPPTTVALVIDALDECDDDRASEKILLALLQHVHCIPSLKIFVSCRPAAYVETLLSSGERRRMFKLHYVPTDVVDGDLRLYYHQRLEEIRITKRVETADWLPEQTIERLVQQAAGLFIFAVTVCRYVASRGDAKRRLEHINSLTKGEYDNALSVDMLYTEVLSAALQKISDPRDRRDFARILATVMLAQESLTMNALGQLLRIETTVVCDLLRDLHPILSVSDETGALPDDVVHTFHASFPEYMTARNRVGEKVPLIYIDPSIHHLEMALCCLRCMNRELKRIIPFPGRFSSEDNGPSIPIAQTCISKALRYATLYWADHFSSALPEGLREQELPLLLLEELQQFTSTKFLFWFECMCLLDAAESIIEILIKGKHSFMSLLSINGLPSFRHPTLELLEDAYHAANEFFPILRNVFAGHIYLSFLMLLPQDTLLYRRYKHHLPPDWKVTGQQRKTWNPLIRSLQLTPFSDTVTFSPDERRILEVDSYVSAVTVLSSTWRAISTILPESPVYTKWEHEKIPGVDAAFPRLDSDNLQPAITSTVWLPSGQIISCCTILSDIETPYRSYCYVSLWDSETGAHLRLLYKTMENTNMFLPVLKSSPDFRYIGYSTPSVHILWDTETWDKVIFSPTRTPFYRCFAVSNSHYLIGAEIRNIARESRSLFTLGINPQQVMSCAFSCDGQTIALALTGGLIEAWSIPLSKMVASYQLAPAAESPGLYLSLASSPRSNFIAVCSGVEVYLLHIGDDSIVPAGHFRGPYPAYLRAVSYSPGGQYIACRDNNGMVHVWSSEASIAQMPEFEGSSDSWQSIRSSSCCFIDGRFCISGTHDGTLSIWECDTGAVTQSWDAQSSVNAIAISTDGRFIASSGFEEARIWSITKVDSAQPLFNLELEVVIAASVEAVGFIPSTCAVTFSSDSTMLAISTGFNVDIWKLAEFNNWQRFTQIRTSLTRFIPHDDVALADDFIRGNSSSLRALRFSYQWLAHSYHKLSVQVPSYFRYQISEAEYAESLQQCRGAFEWWKLPKSQLDILTFAHFQLYFSPDTKYILTPSGIYEVATGKEVVNHERVRRPWEDSKFEELEVQYFWENNKQQYKRNGILETLHPVHYRTGWIADSDDNLCFWIPHSHYHDTWPWTPWYSCASNGDRFAFISRDNSNLVFIHVPGAGAVN
ncbi:hypothetical protein C8J55DRAFT_557095 [Lentinula edodes]|uniref:NACHT domain-containing protein n=1 Tax=Lentinula lateritia TaxID=40482 RepID=A0A9W9AX03_9AGAR|nr:hypothetical protein C8J55DRAFT_557095 [Lentinula edodes]